MDVAYDHIQEEILSPEEAAKKEGEGKQKEGNLNTEFQEAYKSFSSSPWGTKLGGFFSDFKKQSGTFIDEAKAEATDMRGEAFKGFTDLKDSLVGRARSMSSGQSPEATPRASTSVEASTEEDGKQRTESEALRESEGVISRFRAEATKRLKELEKAEEAADAAIFRFGANIGNFLKEAVTIAPPTDDEAKDGARKMRFESKDQDGKRVFHSTRFDAQLHAVHSSFDSFTKDPESSEYEKWKADFDVEKKTDAIAADMEKYEELRRAMEKLVPEQVEYAIFWTRYYFLRMIVETKEQERRDVLKGAAQSPDEEPIGWDDDSDDDDNTSEQQASTPRKLPTSNKANAPETSTSTSSTTTIHQPSTGTDNETSPPASHLKPSEPRRSQDQHSQPDSDASYDLVSGATSRAPGSPKEMMAGAGGIGAATKKKDDEEEEDWE